MSSRQEEKERRRQEREAAERAAEASSARRRRLGMVGAGVLAVAVAVIVVLAIASGGGDDGDGGGGGSQIGEVKAPSQGNENNLEVAAREAGCKLTNHRSEGRGHTTEPVKYNSNPPTSGSHDPTWAEDGEYDSAPDVEQSVHALEHGRINFQYKPGSPPNRIGQLKSVFNEETKGTSGYHSLLFPNQTSMTAAVAATAWTKSLTCPQWNDKVFDALRAFRKEYVDKGPEFIP